MKLFDKYVARFQSAIDDEYQLDVMYRSLTIDNVIYTWTLLSVGAVLTWAVPPAYVVFPVDTYPAACGRVFFRAVCAAAFGGQGGIDKHGTWCTGADCVCVDSWASAASTV